MASSTRTVNVKFDGDAEGLRRAAKDGEREVDRFNKSVDKKFRTSGDDSSKGFTSRFGANFKKWFKGDGEGLFKEIGKSGGTVFGSGLLGALKTPILGPAILAAATAVVATAAPAAGAIVAGGVVLGFGAGLAALGISFAAKNAEVQAAWKRTLSDMGGEMQILSKPFETTLLAMTVVARRTFATFKPELDKAFKKIAPALTVFGDQVGKALEGLAPAVEPLADAFAAVVKTLGPATRDAIGNVSEGLQDLAASVKKNPDALADMIRGVGDTSKALLDLITHLNDVNTAFSNITGGTSLVDVVLGGITGQVKGLDLAFRTVTAPVTLADKALQKLGVRSKDTGDSTDNFSASLLDLVGKIPPVSKQVESLATKFDRQWRATQKANEELFRNSGLLLSLSGAEIGYEAALDAATESVKANGKTLDIHTEKGRANKTALDNIAIAANQQTESLKNLAKDGNVKAAASAEEARKSFVKQAQQMGLSKKEAEKMAASLIAIPNVTRTAKLTANITDLETKLATAKEKLKDPKLTATQKAKLNADIANLEAGIAEAKRQLGTVPSSKTVTIWTVNKTNPSGVGRRASGGPVSAGRTYLVGEKGPELVTMSGNGHVTPNNKLGALAGDTIVYITIDGEQLQGRIDKTVRTNNRNLKRTVKAA